MWKHGEACCFQLHWYKIIIIIQTNNNIITRISSILKNYIRILNCVVCEIYLMLDHIDCQCVMWHALMDFINEDISPVRMINLFHFFFLFFFHTTIKAMDGVASTLSQYLIFTTILAMLFYKFSKIWRMNVSFESRMMTIIIIISTSYVK